MSMMVYVTDRMS